MTCEQMVRDLLSRAARDGLIDCPNCDPQDMTAGDLVATANLLQSFLKAAADARDARWQRAVGMDLGLAEELAAGEDQL